MIRRLLPAFLLVFCSTIHAAESYEVAGASYRAMREIEGPTNKPILVTEFLHQGLINLAPKDGDPRLENAGKTVLVTTKAKKPVPFKILQLGPGDFCRIAIQSDGKTGSYLVYYGLPAGKSPNRDVKIPDWTAEYGLLFETRRAESQFSMDNVESLQKAFAKSSPIGADYVPTVNQGYNPLTLRREPFISRYTGVLNVKDPGRYAVVTSSHHCSFLLIDGNVVASHPGRHHRSGDARPELLKQVSLTQGKHRFEYWHATGDQTTSMLVVWQLNPPSVNKEMKLTPIPPEAFLGDAIARVNAGPVSLADQPGTPDFDFRVIGSVPLPGNEQHLVAVQFQNKSTGLAARGKWTWNFGDGLTSDEASPGHIFLKPGVYSVELVSETATQKLSAANRIEVEQPHRFPDPKNPPTLELYLPILEKYDATKLDADSLLQLIEAYQAKIETYTNPSEAELAAAEAAMMQTEVSPGETTTRPAGRAPVRPRPAARQDDPKKKEVDKYRHLIAESVRAALVDNPNFKGDNSVYKLALLAGTLARDNLEDWKLAGQIYVAAAEKIQFNEFAAECYALAADVSLDMQNITAAKKYLDAAAKKTSRMGVGRPISTFYRVQADYLAETGKGEEAREALEKATVAAETRSQYSERIALQGSASRSAETFLREGNYDRAIKALRTWQLDYPAAAHEGYITSLFAKYWLGREKYPQAAALADRQLTLNPDSPYIDEMLLIAAEAQEKAGNKDAAKAYLRSLIKDYPGSPFVSEAKEQLEKIE